MILAKSLKMLWPEAEIWTVYNLTYSQPEHCVVALDGMIWDGDRVCSENTFMEQWKASEDSLWHCEYTLHPFEPQECLDAGFPDIMNSRLADFISKKLHFVY